MTATPALAPAFGSIPHFENVIGHGLVGCLMASAGGGTCGSGAAAGAVPAFAGPLINGKSFSVRALVLNATLGGLASVAGGGKFANGAVTGAFGYLANHLGHMLVGTDADYQLRTYLQLRDPGMWSGNTTLDGTFGTGRPDLIYDSMPRDVFEIKPDGSDAAGAAQLRRYLGTPGAQSVAGDFDLIFQGSPFIRITGGWFGNTEYTFRPSKFPGVVTYTVEDINIFEQALRLFTQRPAGMPLPLGPRIPPILVR